MGPGPRRTNRSNGPTLVAKVTKNMVLRNHVEKAKDIDMYEADLSRKRNTDGDDVSKQVVTIVEDSPAVVAVDTVVDPATVPPSPPPKQDLKRSKTNTTGTNVDQNAKNTTAQLVGTPEVRRRAQ